MRLGSTRSPKLSEVLKLAIYQGLCDTHTALPGKVESYNPETQKANVKPLLKRNVVNIDATELLEELPVIPEVPLMFPRANDFFITFPIQPGDFVLLVFNERSIDKYMAGEGIDTDPVDLRTHDLSDAVAFPGFAPTSKAIRDHNADDMVIGKDDGGLQIRITNGASLHIDYAGGNQLTLSSKDESATLQLGDGSKHVAIAEALQTLWNSMKSTLDTWGGAAGHVHSTGVGPSGPPSPALSVNSWDSDIKSQRVSIPDNP